MSGTTRVSRYQEGKTNLDLLKQETVSGSGISWAACKSAPRSRQITMPTPHHSSFLQARCPSCHPTNSVKALKALKAPFFLCTHVPITEICKKITADLKNINFYKIFQLSNYVPILKVIF